MENKKPLPWEIDDKIEESTPEPTIDNSNFVKELKEANENKVEDKTFTLTVSSSLIKAITYKGDLRDYCPTKIKATYIDKTHKTATSDAMLKGQFFETLAIGGGANDQKVFDLPRKLVSSKILKENPNAIGEKRADQVRIEAQVEVFKSLAEKYKVTVTDSNVQIVLKKVWEKKPNILIKGTLDIFPTSLYNEFYSEESTIVDLKLTGDLESTYPPEFAWGDPRNIDPIQAMIYIYLVKDIDMELNKHLLDTLFFEPLVKKYNGILPIFNKSKFFFWVFDYKKQPMKNKWFPVDINPTRIAEMHEVIRKVVGEIESYEEHGYPTYASRDNCNKCPLNIHNGGDCLEAKDLNVI